MKRFGLLPLLVSLVAVQLAGCETSNQPRSIEEQLRMMKTRRSVDDYEAVRAEFFELARARDGESLYLMMGAYDFPKPAVLDFMEQIVFPFFADYVEIIEPEILNVVNDEFGDPGYTLYGFISTTSGEKKPYAIAIIEKGDGFAVKNLVVDRCFGAYHPNC